MATVSWWKTDQESKESPKWKRDSLSAQFIFYFGISLKISATAKQQQLQALRLVMRLIS